MSEASKAGRSLIVGTLAAAFGVGAVAGVIAERALIGRTLKRQHESDEQFGALHTEPIEITATDGLTIRAEVEECLDPDNRFTIIFAHGYALRMDEFHFQRRDLRHLARMVFYDQRGHGQSDRGNRSNHTIAQLAADLEAVIEATTPSGDIVLVGHSMGGMTIQALAGRRPDWFASRIKGVVLACTSSGGMTEVPLGLPPGLGKLIIGLAPSVTGALKGQQRIVDRSREAGSDLTLLLTRHYSFGSQVPSGLTALVANMHGTTSIDVIGDFLDSIRQYDSTPWLPTLAQCKVVVVGAESDLLTPVAHSKAIADAIAGARLVTIPDTGHMLPLERYIEFNDIISNLVREVRAAE